MQKLVIFFSGLAVAAAQYGYGCAPSCVGEAACVQGACRCLAPQLVYEPAIGCMPMPVLPIAPAPVVVSRLIPQALPGAPCEPGVECTGGSVCSLGICVCPPELVQEGTVCVARTIYGVVPPPVVPVPVLPAISVALLPVGAPCAPMMAMPSARGCVRGATCSQAGVCQCTMAHMPTPQGQCIRTRNFRKL